MAALVLPLGCAAPPRLLAFRTATVSLPLRRPGIGLVFPVAMPAPPPAPTLRRLHPRSLLPQEGYDAAIATETQCPWHSHGLPQTSNREEEGPVQPAHPVAPATIRYDVAGRAAATCPP